MTIFSISTLSAKVVIQFTDVEVYKILERSKSPFSCLLFFINLLCKAKRKRNFSMSLHRKYYKKEETIINQFFIRFILFLFFNKNNEK
jgi:hypothetical protein